MPKRLRKLNLPASVIYDKEKKKYGPAVTALMAFILVFMFMVMWALFIAGPARVHEVEQDKIYAAIRKQVPQVEGLSEHVFSYVTFNGYTDEKLYWFDQKGDVICDRPISTLDYDTAKARAQEEFGIEAQSIQLAFGYNQPCYEIEGSGQLILLDYDTLTRVYQRKTDAMPI